jgi:hypothetical protein
MHDTLHPDIKSFLDEIVFIDNSIYVKGWAFHNFVPLLALRVVGDNYIENVIVEERLDVNQFYNKFDMILCGWSCTYPAQESLWLEALVDGEWIKIVKLYTKEPSFSPQTNDNICSFIVVDNFYKNPDEVREFALQQEFIEHKEYHKGKRTDKLFKFPGLKEKFENLLGRKIKNWDTHGTNGCFQYCIGGDQLVYHNDFQTYAGLIYLTPDAPPESGTTFYRSKHTKKMKVEHGESNIVFQNGFLDPTQFDVVDVVGNVYNRLVLFDAQFIHAASCYFGNTISNGRLFQLFFFDFEE